MYNFAVSATYSLNTLQTIGAKCLVMDKKENCAIINYYMTGLRNVIDDSLKYLPVDDNILFDGDKLLELLKKYDKDLVIINYEIESCKNLEQIQEKLNKIDNIIGILDKYIRENKYAVYITSFYGIEKDVYNKKQELCKINFSGRSPLIIDDEGIVAANYSVSEGSLYDLANSIYTSINPKHKEPGLLKKKSSLLSFLYKKPKEK